MVVMILENAPKSLRGELSRFLIEPKAGVFVGKVSALVREKLWELCLKRRKLSGVIQIWSDANEQGFSVKSFGDTSRSIKQVEGLWLAAIPDESHAPRLRAVLKQAGLDV